MRSNTLILLAASLLAAFSTGCGRDSGPYDLVLKGGHVIDPKNGIDEVRDVAIAHGKIARVARNIPTEGAGRVVDVAGLYVTPGLIDLHVHVYAGTGMARVYTGDLSVYPDGHSFRSGVTTMVDAGTAGWRNFPDFRDRVIDRAQTRVLALLNICGLGMQGENEHDPSDMDPEATARMAGEHKDIVVGVKTAHYRGREWVSVDRAVQAAEKAGLPVMVDFGGNHKERPIGELYQEHLRPGDMYTHVYSGLREELLPDGSLNPALEAGRQRGILFDVGHGGGSFMWRVASKAFEEGFFPDSISTDLHTGSMNRGMKDMLNVMAKVLNHGPSLAEVIRMSTWNPAQQIKRTELGHLDEGAEADIAVLRLDEGRFGFADSRGFREEGTKWLAAELTLRNGKVMWDLNGRAADVWESFYNK